MGIWCKNRKNFIWGLIGTKYVVLFWTQNIKIPFEIRHSSYTSNLVYMSTWVSMFNMCACVCACVWSYTSYPNNSIWSEDLKSVETPPPIVGYVGGWVDKWVNGWVDGWGSCQITKNQINLIEIIQFCLKIYDLWRHSHLWVGWWVESCQITKIWINFNLIKIIQFSLKFYYLLRHPHLWVGVWVVGWMS